MKKVVVMLSAVACLTWAAHAQSNTEYEQMNNWLFTYMLNGVTPQNNMHDYDLIKMQWSNFGGEIYNKIKASLPPVDPSITAAIENLSKQYRAEAEQKAISLGYASFDDLYYKTYKGTQIPNDAVQDFYTWYTTRGTQVNKEQTALMKSYNDELNSRFQAAFIDAVKKLQENSSSMQ
jgi:hypothetical protein